MIRLLRIVERRLPGDTFFDRLCFLIAFAFFVGMLTAPRWWPE